jgi:uncharacterized protein
MNKRNFIVTLFVMSFMVGVHAQLLWKVSGNGLSKPSYLFGTHHLIERDQINGFDKILDLAGQQDAVVGEMNMGNMLGMEIKMMKGMMMKDSTEKQLMSEADYALVDAELKDVMKMGMNKLGKIKPMMVSTMYSLMIYAKINNLKKQPEAVDILFQKKARKQKKKIIGLETIEQQMDILLNSMPLKRQADLLVKEVKEKEKGVELLKKMNEAYLAGDLQAIEALNNEDDDMSADEKKIMIDNRNANWINQLNALMPTKSCFIAVGCMHLVGETGLIGQLKKSGFTVEAVKNL